MAKFVPDIKTQRWIIISQTRWDRPDDHAHPHIGSVCAFCPGNEESTPEEILRIPFDTEQSRSTQGKGWKLRVIPNKYPITDIHEVIIHTPDHHQDVADMSAQDLAQLLGLYKQRFAAHKKDGQVMIFSNHGEHAGASLMHPHSQVVVLPRQINLDALVREPVMNVVEDTTYFYTYCPDFSQWPYEAWIAPKKESGAFDGVADDELQDLAAVFGRIMARLRAKYKQLTEQHVAGDGRFAYNYYIHHGENWFIRIIPRLIHRAGFELGTGLSVNVVDPTVAAQELRAISL